MKVLFVGGQLDGGFHHVEFPLRNQWDVMAPVPDVGPIAGEFGDMPVSTWKTVSYNLLRLRGETGSHPVYVLCGMSADQAIKRIFELAGGEGRTSNAVPAR